VYLQRRNANDNLQLASWMPWHPNQRFCWSGRCSSTALCAFMGSAAVRWFITLPSVHPAICSTSIPLSTSRWPAQPCNMLQ